MRNSKLSRRRRRVTCSADPTPKVAARWTDNRKGLEDDYLAEMTNDHKDTIELFEKAAKSEDPDIAEFALKTLPHLREHLETIKQLKKST